jgi:hypothetical protein
VLRDHFAATFRYLSPRARNNERDREALRWLAERAAEIGIVEAHEALAEAASDDETRKMHLLIGSRFASGTDKARLQGRANRIVLLPDVEKKVRATANKFEPITIRGFYSSDRETLNQL